MFGSLSPEARIYMEKIYNSTESLIDLVNNILDISKIEAGRFEIIKSETDIQKTIQLCIDNFRTLYKEKGIDLVLTNNSTITTIITDASKYTLICNNLLSNAYKFTESGGRVEFEVFDEHDRIYVRVSDSGKGIESDRMDHIFEKFNQADNGNYTKKSIHGTGLGLHLCKQITHLLGGEIFATSQIGIGSVFTFYIPITH
jgi:two-component system, chemotaxis family, sensor kinase CheA